jgi:hypothetical protein
MHHDAVKRLPASELPRLRLAHLQSGVDAPEDEFSTPGSMLGAEPAVTTGFTEWIGADDPGVSVGWDWLVTAGSGLLLLRAGSIRTNLVLVDAAGSDLCDQATVDTLGRFLGTWDWPAAVLEQLKASPDALGSDC